MLNPCRSKLTSWSSNTVTVRPAILYNELRLTPSNGLSVTVPKDINQGPSSAQNDSWTNIVNPDVIFYKFESQFKPHDPPKHHAYVTEYKVGIIGGTVMVTAKDSRKLVLVMVVKSLLSFLLLLVYGMRCKLYFHFRLSFLVTLVTVADVLSLSRFSDSEDRRKKQRIRQ